MAARADTRHLARTRKALPEAAQRADNLLAIPAAARVVALPAQHQAGQAPQQGRRRARLGGSRAVRTRLGQTIRKAALAGAAAQTVQSASAAGARAEVVPVEGLAGVLTPRLPTWMEGRQLTHLALSPRRHHSQAPARRRAPERRVTHTITGWVAAAVVGAPTQQALVAQVAPEDKAAAAVAVAVPLSAAMAAPVASEGLASSGLSSITKGMSERETFDLEIRTHHFLRPHAAAAGYAITQNGTDFRGLCPQGLPIPPKRLWIGYGPDDEGYIAGGVRHTSKMLEVVRATGFEPFVDGSRTLDFGCGAGRMVRQLKEYATNCEIWGCDLSGDHIIWAKEYLGPAGPFRFITNTTFPHLPFEDRSFRFIYAGSVFSHIDDMADAWLCELRRILATDGRAFLSIHDENTVEQLRAAKLQRLAEQIEANPDFQKHQHDFNVLTFDRGTWAQVFYRTAYFKQQAELMGFRVAKIEPRAYGYQTGVILARA